MEICIVAVGKIKEKSLKMLIEDYSKRLRKYAKLSIIEVKDQPEKKNASIEDLNQLREVEATKIREHIKDGYKIALAIEGNSYSSEGFSKMIEDVKTYYGSRMYFIIGGSYGLSDSLKKEMDRLVSFSMFTFPHQLMRLILLEQLFRSMKISNNEPYHK